MYNLTVFIVGIALVFVGFLIGLGTPTEEYNQSIYDHYKGMFYTHCLSETNLVQCDSLWGKHVEEVKELSHRGLL